MYKELLDFVEKSEIENKEEFINFLTEKSDPKKENEISFDKIMKNENYKDIQKDIEEFYSKKIEEEKQKWHAEISANKNQAEKKEKKEPVELSGIFEKFQEFENKLSSITNNNRLTEYKEIVNSELKDYPEKLKEAVFISENIDKENVINQITKIKDAYSEISKKHDTSVAHGTANLKDTEFEKILDTNLKNN